jgi:hypothetical protein
LQTRRRCSTASSTKRAEIGAGAKGFARTGNHHGVHAGIGFSTAARNSADISSVRALRRSGSLTVMSAT